MAQRAVSRDSRGNAAVELAVFAPVLLLLILATTDLVQSLRAQMRLDSAAVQLGQVVSQCNTINTPGDTAQFWSYAQSIVGNLGAVTGASAQGAVIVSAVYSASGTNKVAWQVRTGNVNQSSSVGTAGGTATIAESFVVPTSQTLLVTEVYLPRQAWVLSAGLMHGTMPEVLNGTTLFMTRAPNATALQQSPTASSLPNCTA